MQCAGRRTADGDNGAYAGIEEALAQYSLPDHAGGTEEKDIHWQDFLNAMWRELAERLFLLCNRGMEEAASNVRIATDRSGHEL